MDVKQIDKELNFSDISEGRRRFLLAERKKIIDELPDVDLYDTTGPSNDLYDY